MQVYLKESWKTDSEGPNQGKIAAIVNVIDQNRVLVDGPTSGVLRQVIYIS